MNLLITTHCNKGCSFCFAQNKNKVYADMTFEDFQRVLDFIQKSQPLPNFKLLGGEPTVHPQFVGFLTEITQRKLTTTLISNGLYTDPAVRSGIKKAIENGTISSILFNVAELTPKSLEILSTNYQEVLPLAKNTNFAVTCGITLKRSLSVEEELAYLSWLFAQLEIHHLRISLDYPGDGLLDDSFLNNRIYGQKIMAMVDLCNKQRTVISGDCILYPCMFEDKFFVRKKLNHFIEQARFVCDPALMPFDVYPDLSFFHCYPAHNFGSKNLLEFTNHQQAMTDMKIRKQALMSMQKKPQQCLNCDYLRNNECSGLCLGCNLPRSVLTQSLA